MVNNNIRNIVIFLISLLKNKNRSTKKAIYTINKKLKNSFEYVINFMNELNHLMLITN